MEHAEQGSASVHHRDPSGPVLPRDLWPELTGLSPRECEIVRLVANDRSNKQISATLGISVWTVSTHLRRIFAKLNVHSRAAMVAAVFQTVSGPRSSGKSMPEWRTTDNL